MKIKKEGSCYIASRLGQPIAQSTDFDKLLALVGMEDDDRSITPELTPEQEAIASKFIAELEL